VFAIVPVTPVPLSDTVCGLPVASLLIEIVPFSCPVALGVNITVIVQDAPAASVEPQLSIFWKLALVAMLEMFNAAVPELVTSMIRG